MQETFIKDDISIVNSKKIVNLKKFQKLAWASHNQYLKLFWNL